MKNVLLLTVLIARFASIGGGKSAESQARVSYSLSSPRIAIVGLISKSPGSRVVEAALGEALARDQRASMVDAAMIEPALRALAYDGSINMNKGEARRLASAIGCDFFVVGKTEAFARSDREAESHQEAYAGIMFVDARTGSLVSFDFVSERAPTREAALNGIANKILSRGFGYVDRLIQFRLSTLSLPSKPTVDLSPNELVEEIPGEGSERIKGFRPPQFSNRVKPDYTREAETADITATVEAAVVFRSNGEVGNIEITRWAGFGLEDSAMRAIRRLKFEPATRDGKPISVRGVVQYNFRRVVVSVARGNSQTVH